MKKRAFLFLIAGGLVFLTGCSTSNDKNAQSYEIGAAGTWTDGSYTETAKGKKGNFDVTVVIQNGSIASVTVGENSETPDLGGAAIAQLPDAIVEAQTYEVDAVSGATVTSEGIRDAVARCLEAASR
ncbi:MAG: FMN-binding protein [Eubacteriales bacterium]|nr:FMN-binding protein [Eubacteriales bacterium]